MHILQLSKRNDEARQRILAAAAKLAKKAGLGDEYVADLTSQEKDPAIRTMIEREGVANLLEALLTAKKPATEKKPPADKKEKVSEEKPMSENPALDPTAPVNENETTGENSTGDATTDTTGSGEVK